MKNTIFRITTFVTGSYHVVLALIILLLPEALTTKALALVLGITLKIDPQLSLIGKFIGAYLLAFGVMNLILSYNPAKYRALALPALTLFGARALNRIFFFSLLSSTFGMTAARNAIGTAAIIGFFFAILLTVPKREP